MAKKSLGQYFTISTQLQDFVFQKAKHKNSVLLEPAFGAGHLLKNFKVFNVNYPMLCYEIDETIKPIVSFNKYQKLVYQDFLEAKIEEKFKTIICNPPYVKTRGKNLYIKFIEKCFEILDKEGEMIFIVPSDFSKITSACDIIKKMNESGSFTDFFYPNNERLFEGASIDVVVFRFENGLKNNNKVLVKNKEEIEEMYYNVRDGIITFSKYPINGKTISDYFDVYVGLVSGKDEVFKSSLGNIAILTNNKKTEKFILINEFPTNNEFINEHLLENKEILLQRKIKKFTERDWFKWGAPRNLKHIEANFGKPCVYIKNISRQKEVAFIDSVQYFGGNLICLIPKSEEISLENTVKFFNSEEFQTNYLYSGRFKIGHKQISNVVF